MLIEALCRIGIESKSLLDVGCGIGSVHLTLLNRGASSAQGVEISEAMLEESRKLAGEMGLETRVRYHRGDIVYSNGSLELSDVSIVDKVVCCYPDFELLLGKLVSKTRTCVAISYPRDSWLSRLVFKGMQRLGTFLRWSFHPYYHEPIAIDGVLAAKGFEERFNGVTIIWQAKVFLREGTIPATIGPAG